MPVRYLLILFSLTSIFFSCTGRTAERKTARGETYVATPNRLYFKNTRQRHYAADDSREGIVVYRHDDLWASGALLLPEIADNWLADRAILRFTVRDSLTAEPTTGPFRLDLERTSGWETLPLTTPPTLEEITRLRSHLATQQSLRVVMGLDTLNPYPGGSREAAKEVLDDYLRLVD